MLVQTISQYLGSHKRLVVPQLGTFIVKEPGVSIVFSELLRRDDGVLRGLLCAGGVGELEAAGEIDRFVFEVRHAVEHSAEYRLEGFGVLRPGPNATIVFAYEPRPAQAEPETGAKPGTGRATAPPPSAAAASADSQPARLLYDEPRISTSAKMNPDPSVRGLRYGKPPKSTNAYTYVDRPRRRGADRFVWIAVIAAAIAVAAIAFGYFHQAKEREAEMQYLEQPAAPQDGTAAAPQPGQPITE